MLLEIALPSGFRRKKWANQESNLQANLQKCVESNAMNIILQRVKQNEPSPTYIRNPRSTTFEFPHEHDTNQ